jgi:hypothetical protein
MTMTLSGADVVMVMTPTGHTTWKMTPSSLMHGVLVVPGDVVLPRSRRSDRRGVGGRLSGGPSQG